MVEEITARRHLDGYYRLCGYRIFHALSESLILVILSGGHFFGWKRANNLHMKYNNFNISLRQC